MPIPGDWLARALARAGVLTTVEAERAIRDGRVRVDGRVIRQPLALLPQGALVTLDGGPVSLEAKVLALMLHKPPDAVTSRSEPGGARTVFDVLLPQLPPDLRRLEWHACGRLDRDTTGLLVFTNDGRLVEHLTSPDRHLPKRYRAAVQGAATGEQVQQLRDGVALNDGPARAVEAFTVGTSQVELVVTEGRNRMVRRMLAAVGLPVTKLHRLGVGGLRVDIREGEWRALSDGELKDALGFPLSSGAP
ncbi:MAG TPA: pseudouridine synthase [Myxococcaceae bacterium]|nr:pseudouridine synthase [Myxococcaceae bacterium]